MTFGQRLTLYRFCYGGPANGFQTLVGATAEGAGQSGLKYRFASGDARSVYVPQIC